MSLQDASINIKNNNTITNESYNTTSNTTNMRRGAPLSQQDRKPVIVSDTVDLEGGSGVGGGGGVGGSDSIPGSPPRSVVGDDDYSKTNKGGGYGSGGDDGGSALMESLTIGGSISSGMGGRRYHSSLTGRNRIAFAYLTSWSPATLQRAALLTLIVPILISIFFSSWASVMFTIMVWVFAAVAFGVVSSLYLSQSVLSCDDGTEEMRAVSDPIREGAEGFLSVQYNAIAKFAVPLAILLVVSYQFRPPLDPNSHSTTSSISQLGNTVLGMLTAFGFLTGAICSAVAGYTSMWVAAQSNIRVASAARRSYAEALVVCFRGGAFSAVLNLTLCVAGVSTLFIVLHHTFVTYGSSYQLRTTDIPILLVGYGFGASFVALFMQLGGGIYTKAADVGADLVGKIEQSIPEDDPRNPATIADLVGDMVGDCVGSSADVFESVAAEIIGAMILGSTLALEAGMSDEVACKFLFFPLVVHAMDIVVSSAGIAMVSLDNANTNKREQSNPMVQLQRGYKTAMFLSVVGFFFITRWLLDDPTQNSNVSFKFFLCGIVGMVCAYVIVLSTQYYTDYEYRPVQSISEASTTGHGTNIIVGISVGLKATFIPTIAVAVSVLAAYHLGASTNIGTGRNAGLFGTAVATMGMLSNAVYILSMNNFGPIAITPEAFPKCPCSRNTSETLPIDWTLREMLPRPLPRDIPSDRRPWRAFFCSVPLWMNFRNFRDFPSNQSTLPLPKFWWED